MNYYELLGLQREPFSTTPDPYFFYRSPQHQEALERLEIALRLRRGLNLIIGDIGSGKTTLARVLLQNFGCVPPFTHSALKRAIRLMIPAVRRQLHMDPHGSNMHLSKQNQQVSDICSQS